MKVPADKIGVNNMPQKNLMLDRPSSVTDNLREGIIPSRAMKLYCHDRDGI